MGRLTRWVGYLGFGFFLFLLFLYWTFPYDALKDWLGRTIEQASGGTVSVSVGHVDAHWFTGLEFEDVRFEPRAATPAEGAASGAAAPAALQIPRAVVRAHVMSILGGAPAASFALQLAKGEIEGDVRSGEDGIEVALTLDDVALEQFPQLAQASGLRLSGEVAGEVRALIQPQQVKAWQGSVDLQWRQWKIGKGSSRLQQISQQLGLTLDDDYVLSGPKGSGVQAKLEKGTLTIASLRLADGDLGFDLGGQIFLERPLPNSRLNLKGEMVIGQKLAAILPAKQGDPIELSGRFTRVTPKIGSLPLPGFCLAGCQ